VIFDLPKLQITNRDVASLFERADENRDDDFVILESISSSWLFLYVFFRFKVYFSKLHFRGQIGSSSRKEALALTNFFPDYFPKNVDAKKLQSALIELLEKNETQKIPTKPINEIIELIRSDKIIHQNKKLAECFQTLFDYKLVLTKDEFVKLKKDLCSWKLSSGEDYFEHTTKRGDIELDDDIALKLNPDKTKEKEWSKNSRLLFKQIQKGYYLHSAKIEPTPARLLRYLYDLGNVKTGEYHYKKIAEKLGSKNPIVISNAVKAINDVAEKYNRKPIVISGAIDGEKLLDYSLDCIKEKCSFQ